MFAKCFKFILHGHISGLLPWLFLQLGQSLGARMEMVRNTTELLDKLLQGYDKRLRPGFGGPPLPVDVNLNIRSMGPVSEKDMSYQLDCYFRQSWVDRRLKFSGPLEILPVSINVLEKLWKPDTHFVNGKKSYLHTVTSPNKLLRIHRDGRILYSMRLTVKASCPMHLENFPMDTQLCPLFVGSHGYGIEDLTYFWTKGAAKSIKMSPDMRLSQFDLIGHPAGNDTVSYTRGTFSMLIVRFALRRHMGYFLINVYVPCSLLVVISWVAFWINREATADRIALGIMTVLTMAFLGIENRRDLPEVSYSTALDYFLGVCFAFVLATIIQFAGVHYFTKQDSGEHVDESDSDDEADQDEETIKNRIYCLNRERYKYYQQGSKANGTTTFGLRYEDMGNSSLPAREGFWRQLYKCLQGSAKYRDLRTLSSQGDTNSVSKIDRVSRIVFPSLFILFHVFYWSLYLNDNDTDVLI